jgi:hypothetical protein
MSLRANLPRLIFVLFTATVLTTAWRQLAGAERATSAPKVDFSYAFATPHRITVGRPDASDRTLLDLQPGSLRVAWSYENLSMAHFPICAFKTPGTAWSIQVTPQVDGHVFAHSRWTRLDDVLPALENVYEDAAGSLRFEAVGGNSAALVYIQVANTDSKPHQFVVRCDSGGWGENPAWLDKERNPGDNLVAGWNENADRVLIFGVGADAYSLQPDHSAPGPKNMVLVWNLKPDQKREGWIIRPYRGYAANLPAMRKHDWADEMKQARQEWHDLLDRACKLSIPDAGVCHACLACLADLFIMREPAPTAGYLATVPGTECYRAGNSAEPGIVSVALDQNGFFKESIPGYRASLEMQAPDGNWADVKGWMHSMWCASGFKSWVIMEHYRLTRYKEFLAEMYPRMTASSRWQESQRAHMRPANDKHSPTYGLMPRGFGDAGLMNDSDNYGIFFPHNIWAVYADRCSVEAAEILGKTADLPELKKICNTARIELLAAIERGAIREKGYRWIPGVPGKTSGSSWGVLNSVTPCGLLPPDHELITGTLRRIESNVSQGGQPLHTGWMADGAWVAITLDNLAEVLLARGNGDAAVKYFYSTLNHGTPLYTWCEERGAAHGAANCSGDRQHLWTPVAVVRCLRDMMVLENGNGLELAVGTAREWLASGKPVGIAGAPTHVGPVSYQIEYDPATSQVTGEVKFADNSTAAWAVLHIRLPGQRVKSVNAESKATVAADGSGIRWDAPRGSMRFQATVEK